MTIWSEWDADYTGRGQETKPTLFGGGMMKRLLAVVVATCVVTVCLAGVSESQCVPGPGGTCQIPRTQWRASAQRTNSIPFGGRLVPVRPFIRPVQPVQPRAQINVQPATPQVIVQSDPNSQRSADSLAQIAANTQPLLPPLPDQPEDGTNPIAVVLCVVGAIGVGLFVYYVIGKN